MISNVISSEPYVFCRRQKRGRVEKSAYNYSANPDFSTPFASLTTAEMTVGVFYIAKERKKIAKDF